MSMPQPTATHEAPAARGEVTLLRGLSLVDSVLLMVGSVIGSGIFLTAAPIATAVHKPVYFLGIWMAGGLISLLACFAFAEMAARYPEAGGQYVYLREAYGEFPAFLYGWMIFTVGQSGTIAALAVGFAEYFGVVVPFASAHAPLATIWRFSLTRGDVSAVVAIAVLTVINIFGLKKGSTLVNVATWAKFAAIAGFVALGLTIGHGSWANYRAMLPLDQAPSFSHVLSGFGVALIAVFWAFDGWVYITWVAGEIKNPQRVLPRTLLIGISLIAAIYISVSVVYLYALPITQVAKEPTIAQAAATALFSSKAAGVLAAVIALSCFGAASGAILCSARVTYAMARDRAFFHAMGRVHRKYRTPHIGLIACSSWATVLALSGTFDQLYTYVMFMMVLSYVASVAGLFILRRKHPEAQPVYRCTGYPYTPLLYILFAGAWALNSVVTRPKETLIGIGIVFLGAPFYFFWRRQMRKQVSPLQLDESHNSA
jgi:APA family basic amino acid/polyamine antiporter